MSEDDNINQDIKDPYSTHPKNMITPRDMLKTNVNASTAMKTPNGATRSSVKTSKNGRRIKSSRRTHQKQYQQEYSSLDQYEDNNAVADEVDPTGGNNNKNSISYAPNEVNRFDSFWNELKNRPSGSNQSNIMLSRENTSQRSMNISKKPSKKLRSAIANSESRIQHFQNYRSKPARTKQTVKKDVNLYGEE